LWALVFHDDRFVRVVSDLGKVEIFELGVIHGGVFVEADGVGFEAFCGSFVVSSDEFSVFREDVVSSSFFLSGWEFEVVSLLPCEPLKIGNWSTRGCGVQKD